MAAARDSVFISYRRSDSPGQAGRLAAELKRRFGEHLVFFDTEAIEPGQPFPERIREALSRARVVLVVVGESWLRAVDEYGRRRIDDREDWVHREIVAALGSDGVTVIPVLVDIARMPPPKAFPAELVGLVERQLMRLEHDQFVQQADGIAQHVRKLLGPADRTSEVDGFDPVALGCYSIAAEAAHATLELAGFVTRLRVRIELDELYVPLRAMLDLRPHGVAEFADAEHAESLLRETRGGHEIALNSAFAEARRRKARGLVILGDPGSGKTTQLKRLLLSSLRSDGAELGLAPDEALLPVFLRLRELRDQSSRIESFIEQQLAAVHPDLPPDFGRGLIRRGGLLLLFDGLDEVADPGQRAAVARAIEALARQRPSCLPVVTCRFVGYGGAARLDEQFLELHLRPLTSDQANQFIRNWYRVVEMGLAPTSEQGSSLAEQKANALIERLREPDFRTARLVQMTRNPLLLANLCLVHRDRGTLPKGRAQLYHECVEVLLERWREGKQLGVSVSSEVGRRALQPAALWLHCQKAQGEDGGRTRATAAELAPVLEPALKASRWPGGSAADFLCRVRDESGLLTGWGPEQFGFMHLGFQEYLAASEVRRRASEGDAAPLRELAAQYGVSWWQEVILVLLSMGNPSMFERFMREVVQQKAFGQTLEPMGLILEDAVEVSEAPFVELLGEPPGKAQHDLWRRQLNALQVLERMGAREAIDSLREQLAKHPFQVIRARFEARTAAAVGVERELHERTGIELVRIPAGKFRMGSPEGQGDARERPQHEVTVSAFLLGKYPVTNEQYARFLQANPEAREPEYWADRRFNQARQPVVGVSWEDAQAYAEWAGLRLPTEAEWEYACRAGTHTQYSSGDTEEDLGRVGWFRGNSEGRLHEVGEKPPNAFGVFDLHGNVWEWCADWYGAYHAEAATDPTGPDGGGNRVLRGGSWFFVAQDARSASRHGIPPAIRYDNFGFRLARGPRTSK